MPIDQVIASLARLRRDIEDGCSKRPIHTIDLNARALLSDVGGD